MEAKSLQDRLSNNAEAFDGLLSLIPSKLYYGEEPNDEWPKKKQSKAAAKAARRGNLNPNSALNRNAKEVMDERAKKRKLDEMSHNDESPDSPGMDVGDAEPEQPREGLRLHLDDVPPRKQPISKAKKAKNVEKRKKTQEKSAAKKMAREEKHQGMPNGTCATDPQQSTREETDKRAAAEPALEQPNLDDAPESSVTKKLKTKKVNLKKEKSENGEMQRLDKLGETTEMAAEDTYPTPQEQGSDEESTKRTPQSSSDSDPASIVFEHPPSTETADAGQSSVDKSIKGENDGNVPRRKHLKVPDEKQMNVFRERLQAKLAGFREARGAGPNGKQVNRQDLIEARRIEQAKKRAKKKEFYTKAKEEEDRKREEALRAVSVVSSPLGSVSPASHEPSTNFSFGRVSFPDGTQVSRDLGHVLKDGKKKGPSDPKTALLKLENKKAKIAAMDEDKRKDVLEKETWLAARKRAEGEKVKDDETLLKKALKRKEKIKKKSEKEWKVRTSGVNMSMKARQEKREENLRKRKEEKSRSRMRKKTGGKKTGGKSKANKKVKARPGFEGSGVF